LHGEKHLTYAHYHAVAAAAAAQVGGVLYIIGACLWTLEAVASWWCLKTVSYL
jgi:hypothetical protein